MPQGRICLVYTGGTFGMSASASGYATGSGFGAVLRRTIRVAIRPELADRIDIVELTPAIDSANADPSVWVRVAEVIARNYDRYDGFVVVHGTDTMAYTASALSFMLSGLAKPVVLTGAQVPLSATRSDGVANLIGAVEMVSSGATCEVAVYFAGRLMRGNRCTKYASRDLDAFRSPNADELGRAPGEDFDAPAATAAEATDFVPMLPRREVELAVVELHPSLTPRQLDTVLDSSLAGAVLRCYGLGNGPVDRPNLLSVIERASASGIVLVAVSQCAVGGVAMRSYDSGSRLSRAGVASGRDMTTEAALTKLWFLTARETSPETVRHQFQTPLRGEMSPGERK